MVLLCLPWLCSRADFGAPPARDLVVSRLSAERGRSTVLYEYSTVATVGTERYEAETLIRACG